MRADDSPNSTAALGPRVQPDDATIMGLSVSGPARLSDEECARRQAEAVAAYWAAERPRRDAAREAIRADAAERIGLLTERDVLVAGAIAYGCEGTKSKPYRLSNRVIFINSDQQMIRFYLGFLRLAGVRQDQLFFRAVMARSEAMPDSNSPW